MNTNHISSKMSIGAQEDLSKYISPGIQSGRVFSSLAESIKSNLHRIVHLIKAIFHLKIEWLHNPAIAKKLTSNLVELEALECGKLTKEEIHHAQKLAVQIGSAAIKLDIVSANRYSILQLVARSNLVFDKLESNLPSRHSAPSNSPLPPPPTPSIFTNQKACEGVYTLSEKCQRVFDASIENICKQLNIPVPKDSDKKDQITKRYIHTLTLTETEEEAREAITFLREEENQTKDRDKGLRDFIGRIKKIEDCSAIDEEIVRRTRGAGEMRFHATHDQALASIQEHGLSFDHRSYDREKFLKVLDIEEKAGLCLFPFAKGDVKEQRVCTSRQLGHCFDSYGKVNTPEWLRVFTQSVMQNYQQVFPPTELILIKLRELLEKKKEILTTSDVDLFVEFIATNLKAFEEQSNRRRVFIVCKKDIIDETAAKDDYTKLKQDFPEEEVASGFIFSRSPLPINEKWSKTSLSEDGCSFLKPENLDFFILSPQSL